MSMFVVQVLYVRCGVKLSLDGCGMLKCRRCGLIVDGDIVGAWDIRLRG